MPFSSSQLRIQCCVYDTMISRAFCSSSPSVFLLRNLYSYCKMCSSAMNVFFFIVIRLTMWKMKSLLPTVL